MPTPPAPHVTPEETCQVHGVPESICGGHRVVRTSLGDEILGKNEEPEGDTSDVA